ncbi:LLM class flavin-dependent oxidoreductase [Gynurincola endophyticus]|uniref:LLM class flavin-dependent oxidoreductase n=1 Tax=Gynurincola endophyticus TaxID=2479004 RepID=UPI000F8D4188|nr:LLM class flavin-dependent oxidoreductase [Gynurincola endophyticus]
MEFGLYTFVENMYDEVAGNKLSPQQRMQDLLEEAELAEQVGLDVFAIGEHHREEYLASAPGIILAAIAARTNKIKLSSAVTVLSSDDPVRVYQQYATIDLLSKGRAEIMVGRGSFIESYPLFGYDLVNYDKLFAEKLDLLMLANENETVEWKGTTRAPINNLGVYPRAEKPLPIWIAVGGTPQSIMRAAYLKLPLALAIIGGEPHRFAPFMKMYKEEVVKAGLPKDQIQTSVNTHVFIGESAEHAAEVFWPSYKKQMTQLGHERGWLPMEKEQYDYLRSPKGALMVGDPQMVIDKILYEYELFGFTRFMAQMSVGSFPHKEMLKSIELFGTKVVPAVKKALGK